MSLLRGEKVDNAAASMDKAAQSLDNLAQSLDKLVKADTDLSRLAPNSFGHFIWRLSDTVDGVNQHLAAASRTALQVATETAVAGCTIAHKVWVALEGSEQDKQMLEATKRMADGADQTRYLQHVGGQYGPDP